MKADFPEPIVDAIKSLTSTIRRQILIEIHNQGPLSYTELLNVIKTAKGNLNFHLNTLVKAGMVQNFLVENTENEHTSFYKISDTGNSFVEAVFNAFEPKDTMFVPPGSTRELDKEVIPTKPARPEII